MFVVRGSVGEIASNEELDTHAAVYFDSSDRDTAFEMIDDAKVFFIRMPTFS
jgi:hypothetical protein